LSPQNPYNQAFFADVKYKKGQTRWFKGKHAGLPLRVM